MLQACRLQGCDRAPAPRPSPVPLPSPVAAPQCKGFGSKCIVDLNGAPNPLFVVGTNAILSGKAQSRLV